MIQQFEKQNPIILSLIMPCLNEVATLPHCITAALQGLLNLGLSSEIIVVDNGSSDGSQQVALEYGVRLLQAESRGYGAALRHGIENARGDYIIFADSDRSYDWAALRPFMEQLQDGYDLVIGSRINGEILPLAMPWLHRRIGTPFLTTLGNLLYGTQLTDYQSGMRAFRKNSILQLKLKTTGMEFATEMLIRAAQYRLRITEIPITYYPDGRSGASHLRPWRDGWRHLRLMIWTYRAEDKPL